MNESPDLPVSIVIFGASGDLTHRKLIPSLFNLYLKKRLPKEFQVIGFSNIQMDEHAVPKFLVKRIGFIRGIQILKGKIGKNFPRTSFILPVISPMPVIFPT